MRSLWMFAWLFGVVVVPAMVTGEAGGKGVSFKGTDGVTLAGTLQFPTTQPVRGAVVLLAGSGPTDRDGNQPPGLKTDLLKQIAVGLADHGIASLRYDKRGMYANTADLPKDRARFGDFFAWEHFVGDAVLACRFLREQEGIDPKHVGILGHSEGGVLALAAARRLALEGHAPAFLVLLSTPGRPMDVIIDEQLKRLLASQGATNQQRDYFLSENRRICQAIKDTGKVPADVPAGLKALYPAYLGKFLQSDFEVDPGKLAADFSGPVLVIAGTADIQVSAERDAKLLDKALSWRKPDVHTLLVIPDVSHNLKLVKNPADAGFEGPIDVAALEQLQQWMPTALQ